MKYLSISFLLIGAVGLTNEIILILNGVSKHPIFGIMLGLSLITLGIGCFIYLKLGYKGGLYTLMGGILSVYSIVILLNEYEKFINNIGHNNTLGLGIGIAFVTIGIFLLTLGHRYHIKSSKL
jgi:hypothetical protein